MHAIPVTVRRVLFFAGIYAVLVIPLFLISDLRTALLAAAIVMSFMAWLVPTNTPKSPEFREETLVGTEVEAVEKTDPAEKRGYQPIKKDE